ncbi:MAG TPA: hypothetical protein VM012_02345 [Flavitalea sp.]|nr:hypothetical protein [Flavitalea sp.]
MKKFLLILALGAFVACNDDGTGDSTKADSSAAPITVDSSTVTPLDTTGRAADSARAADTTLRK